jgi:hypothetical protein
VWLLLLAGAQAETLTWWADSPEQAAALQAALPAVWPDAPITIDLSPPPPGADGLFLDDDAFWLVQGERLRRHDGHLDAYAAVALARSWSRAITTTAPSLPPPTEPEQPPRAPLTEARWGWSFTAGPASRRPGPSPAFHFVGQTLSAHLLLSGEADPAERVVLFEDGVRSGGLLVRRLGATVGVRQSWPLSRDRQLEGALSIGGRTHLFEDISAQGSSSAWLLPTASARLRACAPPSPTRRARLGGG